MKLYSMFKQLLRNRVAKKTPTHFKLEHTLLVNCDTFYYIFVI